MDTSLGGFLIATIPVIIAIFGMRGKTPAQNGFRWAFGFWGVAIVGPISLYGLTDQGLVGAIMLLLASMLTLFPFGMFLFKVGWTKAARERQRIFFAKAGKEMDAGVMREGLWTKAMLQAKGNPERGAAKYIELLVKEIEIEEEHKIREERARNERATALLVLILVIAVMILMWVTR